MILEGQELKAAVQLIANELSSQLLVFDHHHDLLVDAGEPADCFGTLILSGGLKRAVRSLPELQHLLTGRQVDTLVFRPEETEESLVWTVVPIIARAEFLGSVWTRAQSDEATESRLLVERATPVLAFELLKERAVMEVHRRLGRELLDDLFSPRAKFDETLSRRAAHLGADLTLPHRIIYCISLTPRRRAGSESGGGRPSPSPQSVDNHGADSLLPTGKV